MQTQNNNIIIKARKRYTVLVLCHLLLYNRANALQKITLCRRRSLAKAPPEVYRDLPTYSYGVGTPDYRDSGCFAPFL